MSYKFNPFTGNLDVTPFSLDGAGKIPSDYLPSYVDDVVEYDDLAGFPGTGETGKIYVAKDTGYTYRWTGSVYVRIGSGGEVELNLGSEGSPSLFFNGDANTGLYSPGADQLAISTNGSERLRIDSSGNVFINGSTAATADIALNANGSATFAKQITSTGGLTSWSDGIQMFSPATTVGTIAVSDGPTAGAGTLTFQSGSTETLRIDSSGKVGIGTSSPSYLLDVRRSSAGDVVAFTGSTDGGRPLKFASADNGIFLGAQWTRDIASAGGIHAWAISGSERARIDGSGRLLVGTSSGTTQVAAKFQARAGTAAAQGTIMLSRGTANPTSAQTIGEILFTDSNEGQGAKINAVPDANWATNDYPTRLGFFTTADGASGPTERMRIDSDGNIGFGSSGYGTNFQNTVSINPSEGLISFGMDGRNTLVSGASGCYIFSGGPTGGDFDAGDLILQSRSNVERRIIFATGSTPAVRMEIAGNGNVSVVGALSKGSGSFKIDHPLPEKAATHHLVHSFIEGPQADLIYRGRIQLVNGTASVNIDEIARMTEGTFEALCTNVCCFTSNESDWTAVRGSISGSILTIEAQDPTSTADVCWMVVGERKDQHMLDTNWTDKNGRVITEPIKQQPVAEAS